MKRYNIINMYIRGSNVSPQVSHSLNRLYRHRNEMNKEAKKTFDTWAIKYETEINLQGGNNFDLENLYKLLNKIDDVPSAKFNESQEALAGACTVVTFVADELVCNLINEIRTYRYSLDDAKEKLSGFSNNFGIPSDDDEYYIELAYAISQLSLAQ